MSIEDAIKDLADAIRENTKAVGGMTTRVSVTSSSATEVVDPPPSKPKKTVKPKAAPEPDSEDEEVETPSDWEEKILAITKFVQGKLTDPDDGAENKVKFIALRESYGVDTVPLLPYDKLDEFFVRVTEELS